MHIVATGCMYSISACGAYLVCIASNMDLQVQSTFTCTCVHVANFISHGIPHCICTFTQCGSSPDGEELPVDPQWDPDSTYRVIFRIVKVGCHPVAIAQVAEH